jgi:MFS family permease
MMVLDVMIVSVALPSLQHELGLSPGGLEWVVSAYALALAALIPTGGALGDHFADQLALRLAAGWCRSGRRVRG